MTPTDVITKHTKAMLNEIKTGPWTSSEACRALVRESANLMVSVMATIGSEDPVTVFDELVPLMRAELAEKRLKVAHLAKNIVYDEATK